MELKTGSGPTAIGQTGNDEYFMGMLFEVWAWVCLVPRNMSGVAIYINYIVSANNAT